jgi:hypothetical protein
MYAVVSYDPMETQNSPAKVRMNGLYKSHEDALNRQKKICGDDVIPTFLESKSVVGRNGVISWIKEIPIGDFENLNVYAP